MIKKIKQMAPYYTCRKTCHLMSRDKTLKNIHKGREIKKLDGRNSSTENINYAATCEIHDGIYAGNTAEELRERFSKHRYDAKNRPDKMNSQHTYTNTNTNLTKILKGGY